MKNKIKDFFILIFIILAVIGVPAALFAWLIYTAIDYQVKHPCTDIKDEGLISLAQRTNTNGSGFYFIFVGVAHVDNKDYFYYYSGNENSGYRLNKVDNEDVEVRIFEDVASESARVTINNCTYPEKYDFHVPRGSIQRDFKL